VHGAQRSNTIVALRSLVAFCKRNGTVFRNPTGRIKVGEHGYSVIQPLRPGEVGEAVAAATTPAARLVLALAVTTGRVKASSISMISSACFSWSLLGIGG